ncbi:MAG: UTP--glucose-1-phosphate uridylyltransferase [Chlamydiae bacterium]|nr:UTP--glucose-1-phosphate uridylyltransferase [Chlamydiota bacterium]
MNYCQLFSIDEKTANDQKKAFLQKKTELKNVIPLEHSEKGSLEDIAIGQSQIAEKKVGVLLMAGGQGTRLGTNHPKGMFIINGKSLFQIFCEKILDKQKKYWVKLYGAIMTSSCNHEETLSFFEKNNFFGLKGQLFFFIQDDLAFLDEEGKWFLENGKIMMGPDGNGKIFHHFYKSSIFKKFQKEGIENVVTIPIDNLLADPFDEELLGYHLKNNNDVTIRCIEKNPKYKMGLFAEHDGKLKIVEYFEADESINFKYGNVGIYAISMEFIKKIYDKELPFHLAYKKIDPTKDKMAYKCEHFIFDVLDFTTKAKTLLSDPEKFCLFLKGQESLKEIYERFEQN